ncbi:nitroreductase family protein [Actinokineospora sp. UTMC 2448]|uniref:nitroreductase family protein n=1 Tax=Actinokineospora sp. UTMC 2448 TaxID=2268449 RepID=UPI0021640694|nr:nitroreductase family protein [Actinokineospora sp. UTMC 2448]
MEFQDVVRRRRMVRRFTSEPVSPESLSRILRNARRGPSAGFSQGQAFLVLQGDDLAEFWEFGADWTSDSVRTAPVVIVPFSVKDQYLERYAREDKGWTDRAESHWPVPYWHIDTGMAALLILQTAVDEGLGAVFFGIGPEGAERLHTDFGVPATHEPIGVIAIGHPDEPELSEDASPRRIPRRDLDEIVHFGRW